MPAHPACCLDLLRYVASGYHRQLLAHDDMRQGMEGGVCRCGEQPIRDVVLLYKWRQYCNAYILIRLCLLAVLRLTREGVIVMAGIDNESEAWKRHSWDFQHRRMYAWMRFGGLTRVCCAQLVCSFSQELHGPHSHRRLLKGVLPICCWESGYCCYLLGDARCDCVCPC